MEVEGRIKLCSYEKKSRCKELTALFDSGASTSVISEKVAEELGFDRYDKPKELSLAVKEKKAELVGESRIDIEMDGCKLPISEVFGVVEELRYDAVIGRDLMDKYEIMLGKDKPRLKSRPPELKLI